MLKETDFTDLEILAAYKKLKHYFYFDNTSLFIRDKIAEFEKDVANLVTDHSLYSSAFLRKISEITNTINKKDFTYWEKYFNNFITFKITPKSFHSDTTAILTNRTKEKNIQLDRINIFIDAPIEIHIISVLWLTNVGKYLAEWVDCDNYAYQLETIEEETGNVVVNGFRLYKPYFTQYRNWRDKAIEKAEQLFKEKKDVVILSLDIKDYFHSVKINLTVLEEELYSKNKDLKDGAKITKLFKLLDSLSKVYSEKLNEIKDLPELSKQETILPIGLLSSGLLGNLYLRSFDKAVKNELNPSYYGRYVDDLLFVLTNVEVENNVFSPINHFLDKYFVDRNLLTIHSSPQSDLKLAEFLNKRQTTVRGKDEVRISYREPIYDNSDECQFICNSVLSQKLKFSLKEEPSLIIQSKKVILQDLDHRESPAIINNFKKNLDKNRSEFRFLPDEDEVDIEFDEEAFSLQYNDSLNKLRSIKEFSQDKYGASKYLAGKIFATSLSNEKIDKKTANQILTFFKGQIGLSFHTLWEKVATYFVINEDAESLNKFYRQCKKAINNIDSNKIAEQQFLEPISSKVKEHLDNYLLIAIATPLAFNPNFIYKIKLENNITEKFKQKALSLRYANMLRHLWVGIPAVNYTRYVFEDDGLHNLLRITTSELQAKFGGVVKFGTLSDINILELDERLMLLSPRYVHFHELNVLQIYKVVNGTTENIDSVTIKLFQNILEDSFETLL